MALAPDRHEQFVSLFQRIQASLNERASDTRSPLMGLDEGCNHPTLRQLAGRLYRANLIADWRELWWHKRQTANGTVMVPGSTWPDLRAFGPFPPRDLGRRIRGVSWPDHRVVFMLAIFFFDHDRLCLLTEDLRMRRLLEREIAPLIETYGSGRLGLHVFARRKTTSLDEFGQHVASALENGVAAGFRWDEGV